MSAPQCPLILSDGHLATLRNLAREQDGTRVGWIGIAEARALTDQGLAERSRQGWRITASGVAALAALPSAATAGDGAKVIAFPAH